MAEIDQPATICFFPQQGHRRTDLTGRPLRFIRVRDFLIAYAPDEKPLWVIAVMHGHRVMAAVRRGWEERWRKL